MKIFAIALIKLYRHLISPFLKKRCCFYPSCSNYAITAYKEWGFFKGSYLTIKRILRCHPWSGGGVDYVPTRKKDT